MQQDFFKYVIFTRTVLEQTHALLRLRLSGICVVRSRTYMMIIIIVERLPFYAGYGTWKSYDLISFFAWKKYVENMKKYEEYIVSYEEILENMKNYEENMEQYPLLNGNSEMSPSL